MNKIPTFLLFFLLFHSQTFSQNLVYNPSFEIYTSCPVYYGQLANATGWTSFNYSPEYFNCSSSFAGVPYNDVGFQFARTGNAYTGFVTYTSLTNNFREWIGSKLISPLQIGHLYRVSFYASMAYKKNASGQDVILASNKLGLRFSTVAYPDTNSSIPNGFCHVQTDSIIADTMQWANISGYFTADSLYEYVVIGNFNDDLNTKAVMLGSSSGLPVYSYYYIDDVSVIEMDFETLNEELTNHLSIFPNPTHDFINVKGVEFDRISVYNMLGSLCITSCFAFNNRLNISSLSKGIYSLVIEYDNRQLVKKIIID